MKMIEGERKLTFSRFGMLSSRVISACSSFFYWLISVPMGVFGSHPGDHHFIHCVSHCIMRHCHSSHMAYTQT